MRPFSRDNDGRDETDRLKEPLIISEPALLQSGGAWHDSSGISIVPHGLDATLGSPLRYSAPGELASGDMVPALVEDAGPSGGPLTMSAPNPYMSDPGIEPAGYDEGGGAPPPPSRPPATPAQRNIGGAGPAPSCPKSDCLLWALGGFLIAMAAGDG